MSFRRCLLVAVLCLAGSAATASVGGPLVITAPADRAVVTTPIVRIEGTAVSRTSDFGVVVNNMAAIVDLEHAGTEADPYRWFVETRVERGPAKLTARVVQRGREGGPTAIRHIQYSPEPEAVLCTAHARTGVAPHDVTFFLQSDVEDEIVRADIDYDGDGEYDQSVTGYPDRFEHRYEQPGARVVSVRSVFATGASRIATCVVVTHSFNTLDAQIRELWNAFTTALEKSDVDGALTYVAEYRREKYRARLLLIGTKLPQYAASIRRIVPSGVHGSTAEYLLTKPEDEGTFGYWIAFARGSDGLWKISQL